MIEVAPEFYLAFKLDDPDDRDLAEGIVLLFEHYIAKRGHKYAGKDVPYHKPTNTVVTDVNLRHVHLCPLGANQADMGRWRNYRTSDRCLVYVRSDCGRHLLIAYLHENAHAQAFDHDYIKSLAKIAEAWLYRENIFPDLTQPF